MIALLEPDCEEHREITPVIVLFHSSISPNYCYFCAIIVFFTQISVQFSPNYCSFVCSLSTNQTHLCWVLIFSVAKQTCDGWRVAASAKWYFRTSTSVAKIDAQCRYGLCPIYCSFIHLTLFEWDKFPKLFIFHCLWKKKNQSKVTTVLKHQPSQWVLFTPARDFLLETPWRIIIPNPDVNSHSLWSW
jgi:hypothetical protein